MSITSLVTKSTTALAYKNGVGFVPCKLNTSNFTVRLSPRPLTEIKVSPSASSIFDISFVPAGLPSIYAVILNGPFADPGFIGRVISTVVSEISPELTWQTTSSPIFAIEFASSDCEITSPFGNVLWTEINVGFSFAFLSVDCALSCVIPTTLGTLTALLVGPIET